MKDNNGREYIRASELRVGMTIEVDGGFTCTEPGKKKLFDYGRGMFFPCNQGCHFIDVQILEDGSCLGMYKCETAD